MAHDGNWYILVAGLPVDQDQSVLASGLTLSPLASPVSVFDLAAAGAAGFRQWSLLEPFAAQCTCEFETAKDSDTIPGYDALNRAWLGSALLALRGHVNHFCLAASNYSWSEVAGYQERHSEVFREQLFEEGPGAAVHSPRDPLPPFKGMLLDFHVKYLSVHQNRRGSVSSADATWVKERFESFNSLAAESKAFRYALESAVDWRYATDKRAAIARLWGGIESVFGIKSELVYRLSLHVASLLAEPGPTRIDRFREIKKLYGVRSKAVHGERLDDGKVQAALDQSHEVLRDLLVYCAELGRVPTEADLLESLLG